MCGFLLSPGCSNIEKLHGETEYKQDINADTAEKIQETAQNYNDEPLFSFIVYGDCRPADDLLPPPDVFLKLLGFMKAHRPHFLVSTGDVINGGTDNPKIIEKQFSDYLNALNTIPEANFIACGNHDSANSTARKYFLEMINMKTFIDAKIIGANVFIPNANEAYSGEAAAKDLGDLNSFYYFFKYRNTYFIILNAFEKGYWGAVQSRQLVWLEKTVARLKEDKVFVFIHAPVYSVLNPDNINDGSKHVAFSSKENQDYIRELFKVYKIDGVFSGHEHVYNRQSHEGTEYIITALSGEYPYFPEEEGGFYHFCRIDVKENSWVLNVIDSNGKIRDYEEIEFN